MTKDRGLSAKMGFVIIGCRCLQVSMDPGGRRTQADGKKETQKHPECKPRDT
ncbi:predicted protein [Coccidioides posadasii str. Silveira]|uniref:Predicted protein n=1 Tax=Coccidioides posadasii (strain RMSCC 757 / Silveira) TaxID=443226 RepID=E9CTH1_COCPS|nr:predicted protein [Coccidioides posadasii str. Silveira]